MPTVEVYAHETLGKDLRALTFASPIDLRANRHQPGQFLHIRVSRSFDFLLRRPLSLCDADVEHNRLTVVYRVSGEGTRRLAARKPGDLIDVLGPLGQGFPIHDMDRRALLIGGGVGVPPLLELAKQLRASGKSVQTVVGFQTAGQLMLIEELAVYGEVAVMTDDGSAGERGRVTAALTAELCADADRYYACGPSAMLRAVQEAMRGRGVPGYLSLEERMGCGVGICMGCVHPVVRGGKLTNAKTCREGPVFDAQEVVFP